jgi:hypothetical protein
MSHHVEVSDLPADGEQLQSSKFAQWKSILLGAGGAGLAVSILLFLLGGERASAFAFSYLFAFEVFFTVTAGALFWVLLHSASNSSWGVAIRRVPETVAQSFVLLFLLGLPLFTPMLPLAAKPEWTKHLWEWIGLHQDVLAHPSPEAKGLSLHDALGANHETLLLYKKFPYLHIGWNLLPGWDYRYLIIFASLILAARKMLGLSVSQDGTGDVAPTYKARRWASGLMVVFALCSTFASIDWVKSMNYKWFSTMFGVNVFAGSALASMAVIILVVGTLVKTGHLKHIVSPEHFHLMGKLMFAFTVFWAYIAFSQFFLIWYANIPEETQFYAIRNTNGWWYASLGLVFLHFALPFVLLLRRNAKREVGYIMACAAFILCVHILEIYWMVVPERGRALYDASSATSSVTWIRDVAFDVIALVTFAGLYGFVLLRNLAKHSIYPCGDPRLEESVNVMN